MKTTLFAMAFGSSLSVLATANTAENTVEETVVTGIKSSQTIVLTSADENTADSAELLRKAPGANFNSNGPITGISQLRGLFGTRVCVAIDGQTIGAGGPNWMDPPLSYAPTSLLENMEVFRGISPVSSGQETLGGTIHANTWKGEYSDSSAFTFSGRLAAGAQSINAANNLSLLSSIASNQHKVSIAALSQTAEDANFDKGEISPTEYARQRLDLGYGFKTGNHEWSINIVDNETADAGTPALPMDIEYLDGHLGNIAYTFNNTELQINAKIYGSEIDHSMTNYLLRQAPAANAQWRRNITRAENQGFKVSFDIAALKLGMDHHHEIHNSNIDNPNNPVFFVVNFNNASRTVSGAFAEYKTVIGDKTHMEFGIRANRVAMNADTVDGTPAMMMPPAQALRNSFNNSERKKTDSNIDAVIKISSEINSTITAYSGVAQKSRSPSYQERYLWLPMEATAGLADGRTYTGNLNLKPEVSQEAEAGFDFNHQNFYASPRIFYKSINNYIQGSESTNSAALMFAAMMNPNAAAPLEFNNVDAELYGADLDWRWQFNSALYVSGIVNYVRGKRTDISDDLYRIAPLNASIAIEYSSTQWGLTAETFLYQAQNNVSTTQTEKSTAGYGVVNLSGYWQVNTRIAFSAGINNLLDKYYQDHLAGYNRVTGSDVDLMDRLPGYGRGLFGRVQVSF